MPGVSNSQWVVPLAEVGLADLATVGGKNASLGEMLHALREAGVAVPNGFALTSASFREHLRVNHLDDRIAALLADLNVNDLPELQQRASQVRQMIVDAPLPATVEEDLLRAYDNLRQREGADDVAVRSSATAEDLPEASFAGQQETYLNVRGRFQLVEACRKCFASLFTDRAITYRANLKIPPLSVSLSVGVQRMVRSDLSCAGVMFSIDTETGFQNAVLINASYGLGETVVQGTVTPDEYLVFKPTLRLGYRPILRKTAGTKEFRMIYAEGGGKLTQIVPVPTGERRRFTLTDNEILQLARWALLIEDHYSRIHGRPTPMDIEWAKDGPTGQLFIVQARPETVESRKIRTDLETFKLLAKGPVLAEGRSVGTRIGQGSARVILDVKDLDQLQTGEVLVTERTAPDWEPVMKRAAAIVTSEGGRTCHAAIVSRELGLPAIVGAAGITQRLQDGQPITISCAEGERGFVYEGLLPFRIEHVDVSSIRRPRTKILMNVAKPEEAFRLSFLPNDGVGLVREEFIISDSIKVHPMALVHPEKVTSPADRQKIEELTAAYRNKPDYFVDQLAEGVGTIVAAFYPKEVIVRLSDFKTNEYANLLGGRDFEPKEENPMIGFRGASRYAAPEYREAFALECAALRRVRREMGLRNLKVMVPFCRTPEEGNQVLREMARHGLVRGDEGLEIYVMCEIPSNVLLADRFAEIFDGFSIGSNDLTQLVLGVDRDSQRLAPLFDERNPAVRRMITQAIQTAHRKGVKIGICGQAPSDYPELAAFLVRKGINSLSLNPDAVLAVTQHILEMEDKIPHVPFQSRLVPTSAAPGPPH